MYNQEINLDDYAAILVATNATPTGSTDDTVLRFDGTLTALGNMALADWITITTTAAEGTQLRIIRRGIYRVELHVAVPASSVVWAGISLDANLAQRTANPSVAAAPTVVFGESGLYTLPAATTGAAVATAEIRISQRLAQGAITGNILRLQCSDGSNAAPAAADITAADTWVSIVRTGDLNSVA